MYIKDVIFVYHLLEPEDLRWHGRYHSHGEKEYEVHYFLEGTGSFQNGSVKFTLEPGSLFITPPNVFHNIEASDLEKPISYYAVLLDIDPGIPGIANLFESEINWEKKHLIGDPNRFYFEELREKALSKKTCLQRAAFYQFISFLYLLAGGEDSVQQQAKENAHIEKALMYMQRALYRKTSLSSIAGKLNLSEEHVIRLFKQKLNTTPMKYLMKLRIEAATSMLISSDIQIYAISERLNFNSEFHFSRVFKKYTGESPRFYRNRYRQLIVREPEYD